MPLTHICKALIADDIIRLGEITPTEDKTFEKKLAYFFYGRPAYRIGDEGVVKTEASCPFCFIFDADLIKKAEDIHAFDTGAFGKRLYKHVILKEMELDDFSLERDIERPNKLISRVFQSFDAYFDGDTTKALKPDDGTAPYEFHARAYLQLLASPGRNEPDDRICSIEIVVGEPIQVPGLLRAVVVPHTLWEHKERAPWLTSLDECGVLIRPYQYVPNRHPEHYHALMEGVVRKLYEEWKLLDE